MSAEALSVAVDALQPHLVAVALVSARLVPVAFLCPLFGGPHAPTHVKLGTVLALALFLHGAGGIEAPTTPWSGFALGAMVAQEALFGTALGLVAGLPFDAARLGGRFIDLFRGSSAEAALPMSGTREAATGDALYHLLLALAVTGVAFPALLSALTRSYALVALGTPVTSDALASQVAGFVAAAFSTGLALGAPIAALSLAIDAALGLAARAVPALNLQEVGAPLRILGGGVVLWAAVGLLAARLQDLALTNAEGLGEVAALALPP